ncbi:CDGSH iron-sulfur domain-containing protein [Streptomyces sp. NPDC058691]|uniref:CDGSH iron-sulfur domain-containing protein n=1 Tax=Streptomyces sp. NPDC058691 TaxID=3346601 RepID=UPI0036576DC7
MPNTPERPRRVFAEPHGPVLVEGPVTVVAEDGTTRTSDRFMVAICTCRRSRSYPWCDTSHRVRSRPPQTVEEPARTGEGAQAGGETP